MTERKRAVIYARASDRKQVERDVSIPSQIEECRKKADALGAQVARVFIDEGKTGRNTDRRAFQDAILYCEMNSPDYFITWSTSRFARNRWDAAIFKRRLSAVGTDMRYITLNVDNKDSGGKQIEAFFEIMDEWQSEQISADTRRSMMRNARGGFRNGGRPPFGFEAVTDVLEPKRKRLRPLPAEAEIAQRIVDLRIQGHGYKTIAVLVNADGHLNRGKSWTKSAIGDLLQNEALIGNSIFGKKDRVIGRRRPRSEWIVVKSHEAIISLDKWTMVQQLIKSSVVNAESGSPLSRFLFTGILKCGRCGSSMQIETAKGRSRRYHYYNCRSAQHASGCANRRIRATEFDRWMSDYLAGEIFSAESLQEVVTHLNDARASWLSSHEKRRAAELRKLKSLQNKNSNLYDVLELHGKEAPNLGDLTRRLRQNNEEIKRIEQRIAELDGQQEPDIVFNEAQANDLAGFLAEIIQTSRKVEKVRSFFRSFIDKITVHDTEARIDYRPESLVMRSWEPATVPSKAGWLPGTGLLGTVLLTVELPQWMHRRAA